MTKLELLEKLKEADRKLLDFYNTKPRLHPEVLTNKELTDLIKAFETIYELSVKASKGGRKIWLR